MAARKWPSGPPPKEALRFFRAKGYKPGFDFRDVWREEHATAFTVAKAMEADLLRDIRGALDEALAQGKTLREFQKELTPRLQKAGWWGRNEVTDPLTGKKVTAQLGSPRRLRTIYRANLRTARAAGAWDRAHRVKKRRPYAEYRLGPSREHREEHVSWAGTILPLHDPWWRTHWPPNGWGCKCWVRTLSAREARKLGGPHQTPEVETREWVNRRTGEAERVPMGIDPGWDTNPGAVGRAKRAARSRRRSEAGAKEALSRPILRPVPGIRERVQEPDASFEGMTKERYQALWTGDVDGQEAKDAFLKYMNLSAAPHPNYGARALAGELTAADKAMETAVAAAARPLAQDVTTFRGIKGDHYRNLKLGDSVKFDPVTSTSTSNAWAMRFGSPEFGGDAVDVMFVISNKKGQKALVAHYGEREITLPAGAQFRVTRIETSVPDVPAGLYSWSPATQKQKIRRVIHMEIEEGG